MTPDARLLLLHGERLAGGDRQALQLLLRLQAPVPSALTLMVQDVAILEV